MIHQFLFFPFTHITANQLNTLLTFFPSFQHLSMSEDYTHKKTLKTLAEQGKINPIFLSAKQVTAVEQKIMEYLSWAKLNKGNEHNLKSLLRDNPYFTSSSDVTAIKSQIKGIKDVQKETAPSDFVTQRNLLFLKMAQLCDEQNETIDLELKNLDKTRDSLLSELRGEHILPDDVKESKTSDTTDTGAIMTRERLEAWSGIMAQKKGVKKDNGNPLFVTTSEAVFHYLESNCNDVINALDIDKIKVHENDCENKNSWQHHFCEYLMTAVQGDDTCENKGLKVNDRCSLLGQVKLSFFYGEKIRVLFNMSDKQIPVCLIKLK